jgi:hypothetical protein
MNILTERFVSPFLMSFVSRAALLWSSCTRGACVLACTLSAGKAFGQAAPLLGPPPPIVPADEARIREEARREAEAQAPLLQQSAHKDVYERREYAWRERGRIPAPGSSMTEYAPSLDLTFAGSFYAMEGVALGSRARFGFPIDEWAGAYIEAGTASQRLGVNSDVPTIPRLSLALGFELHCQELRTPKTRLTLVRHSKCRSTTYLDSTLRRSRPSSHTWEAGAWCAWEKAA